jgi:hypothetical protein
VCQAADRWQAPELAFDGRGVAADLHRDAPLQVSTEVVDAVHRDQVPAADEGDTVA